MPLREDPKPVAFFLHHDEIEACERTEPGFRNLLEQRLHSVDARLRILLLRTRLSAANAHCADEIISTIKGMPPAKVTKLLARPDTLRPPAIHLHRIGQLTRRHCEFERGVRFFENPYRREILRCRQRRKTTLGVLPNPKCLRQHGTTT